MIYTADWHLAAAVPVCRTETPEEWLAHQENVLDFIAQKANELQTGVVIVGDLFDRSTAAAAVVSMFLRFVNKVNLGVTVLIGNHDMEYRDTDTTSTSYGILLAISHISSKLMILGVDDCITPYPFVPYTDKSINEWPDVVGAGNNLLIHTMAFQNKDECAFGGVCSEELFAKYDHQRIITGDMHTPFITKKGKRVHINCGCITKRAADYKDVVLGIWNNEEFIQLPTDNGVHDEHRIEMKERDDRVTELLTKLSKHENGATADYHENLRNGLTTGAISGYTVEVLNKWTGGALC